MDISAFLGKFLGLYLIIISPLLILKKDELLEMVGEYTQNKGIMFLGGYIALFMGLAIITLHSVFEMNWKLIITLIGYFATLKGILIFYAPERIMELWTKLLTKENMAIFGVVYFVLGLVLCYFSF